MSQNKPYANTGKSLIHRLSFLIITFLLQLPQSHADSTINFTKAKKLLSKNAKELGLKSFYCGCDIEWRDLKGSPITNKCGYTPRKSFSKSGEINERAKRIEWEHVMPAYRLSKNLSCWANGGRKACKNDQKFNQMEGDLNNLVPAIGEVNGDRSNFEYGIIPGEVRLYGQCDFEIDFKAKKAEPREDIRGDIARIYFYMKDTYNLSLPSDTLKLMEAWGNADPVSEDEISHNRNMIRLGGKKNPYLYSNKKNNLKVANPSKLEPSNKGNSTNKNVTNLSDAKRNNSQSGSHQGIQQNKTLNW